MVPFHAATLRRPRTMKVETDVEASVDAVRADERTVAINRIERREIRRHCRNATESLGR